MPQSPLCRRTVTLAVVLSIAYSFSCFSPAICLAQNKCEDAATNKALLAFCEKAKKQDRGFARPPFFGTCINNYVYKVLQENKQLQKIIKLQPEQMKLLEKSIPKKRKASKKKLTVLDTMDALGALSGQQLEAALSKEQMRLLLPIYLEREGLAALRFTIMQEALSLEKEQKTKILLILNDSLENTMLPIHRWMFHSNGKCEIERMGQILRERSCNIDTRLLAILNSSQQKVLAGLVKKIPDYNQYCTDNNFK